jgi:hypothetical protein
VILFESVRPHAANFQHLVQLLLGDWLLAKYLSINRFPRSSLDARERYGAENWLVQQEGSQRLALIRTRRAYPRIEPAQTS